MARSTHTGPVSGGSLVLSMYQKTNNSAALNVIAIPGVAGKVVTMAGFHTGADSGITINGRTFNASLGVVLANLLDAIEADTLYFGANENAGVSGFSGHLWNQNFVAAAADRTGFPGLHFPRGGGAGLFGANVAARGYSLHAVCTAIGHRYDPDNSASDFPYTSSKD